VVEKPDVSFSVCERERGEFCEMTGIGDRRGRLEVRLFAYYYGKD